MHPWFGWPCNYYQSSCLSLLSARISDVCNHSQQKLSSLRMSCRIDIQGNELADHVGHGGLMVRVASQFWSSDSQTTSWEGRSTFSLFILSQYLYKPHLTMSLQSQIVVSALNPILTCPSYLTVDEDR